MKTNSWNIQICFSLVSSSCLPRTLVRDRKVRRHFLSALGYKYTLQGREKNFDIALILHLVYINTFCIKDEDITFIIHLSSQDT